MEYVEKPTRKSFVDLEGNKYGLLKVLGYMGCDNKHTHLWHVQCDCGNITVLKGAGIKRGLTKSCGCLRKNNGGNAPMTQEEVEKLCPNVKFIEYKGMKKPAKFKCIFCNKQGETHLANNLRVYICECQSGSAEQKRTELFKEKGYTLIESTGWTSREHKIQCDSCGIVSYHKGAALGCIEECKCKSEVTSEDPAAIYCLYNEHDNYIKVGKSIAPMKRLNGINSARELQGEKPLQIYKTIWVVSESAAYYLESLYHTINKGSRLYLEDWTGSTETFSLGIESFDEFIETHRTIISKLKTEEPPRPQIQFSIPFTSFEMDGLWFPSKISARLYFNCNDRVLDIMMTEKLNINEAIEKYTISNKDNIRELTAKYTYKGKLMYLQEIADDLGVNRNTIWYRINKMGMSFEEAIKAVYCPTLYEDINGELIRKTEFENKFNIKYATYYRRLKCGWDKRTAIHHLAERSNNWMYNGIVYSRSNLFKVLGIPIKQSFQFFKSNGVEPTILKYLPNFNLEDISKF